MAAPIWQGCRVDQRAVKGCTSILKPWGFLLFIFSATFFLCRAIYITGLDRAVCGLCLCVFCLHSCCVLSLSWLVSLYSSTLIRCFPEVNHLSFSSTLKRLQFISFFVFSWARPDFPAFSIILFLTNSVWSLMVGKEKQDCSSQCST